MNPRATGRSTAGFIVISLVMLVLLLIGCAEETEETDEHASVEPWSIR